MNSWIDKKHNQYGVAAFSFIIGAYTSYLSLNQTPYANGWDGYYYVMQVHSWLTYGHLQSPDASLIYPYFILINSLISNYELSFKIGTSILGGFLVCAAYLFANDVGKKRLTALLLPAFLIFSPTTIYLISQFPKNVLGLIFLLFLMKSLNNKRFLFSGLFLILSFVSHRMTGGLGLIIVLIYSMRWMNWKWLIGGLTIVLLLSLLPGILHISDLARFNGQLSFTPQFSPYSIYVLFENSIDLWWGIELMMLTISLVYICFHIIFISHVQSLEFKETWIWLLLIFISIFPFFTVEYGSMGYRFFMISPIFIMCIFFSKLELPDVFVYASISLLLLTSVFSYKSYNPKLHDPPNQLYELIINRLKESYSPSDYPLVIVHKSLAEMIIYKTEFDALNWSAPSNIDTGDVLRIVSNLDYIHFSKYLEENEIRSIVKLTLHYFSIPENIWEEYYNRILEHNDKAILDRIMMGSNPLNERPYFLLKGKEIQ